MVAVMGLLSSPSCGAGARSTVKVLKGEEALLAGGGWGRERRGLGVEEGGLWIGGVAVVVAAVVEEEMREA